MMPLGSGLGGLTYGGELLTVEVCTKLLVE